MKHQNFPRRTALVTSIALALGLPIASADVFTVNNNSDDVNTVGSLRWAIDQANSNNNPAEIDQIDFDNVTQISAASVFSVTESLRLNGPGIAQLTLDDAGGTFRLFVVESGTQAIDFEISGVSLPRTTNGSAVNDSFITHASTFGGDLRLSNVNMTSSADGRSITTTDANVSVENSTIDNFVGHIGGASMVVTNGNLALRDCVVSNNRNVFGAGGAIQVSNTSTATHTIEVERSTFTNNRTGSAAGYGGGALRILNTAAGGRTNITIEDSTFSGNTADRGGAIYLGPSSGAIQSLTIRGSTLSDNIADGSSNSSAVGFGGAIAVDTNTGTGTSVTITIDNSSFSGNSATTGGGVFDLRISASQTGTPLTANVSISNSTFSDNGAGQDGGMLRGSVVGDGQAEISFVNTTISGNTATAGDGGALHIANDFGGTTSLDMLHTTVTANNAVAGSGGGIFTTTGTTFTLVNSVVAANLAATFDEIRAADTVTANFSLVGDQPGKGAGIPLVSSTGGLITDTDPLLGSLADNGGATLTHALGDSSPAIATADSTGTGSTSSMPANDQRGDGFLRVRDGSPDLGAVEHIPSNGGGGSGGSGAFGWPVALFGFLIMVWRRMRNSL